MISKKTNNKVIGYILAAMAAVLIAANVIVLLGSSTASKYIDPAAKLSHSAFEAEEDTLTDHLQRSGLKQTFAFVHQQLTVNSAFARDCHPLMHHLGHEAFKALGSFQAAMAQADEICNSGYIHGLIEANFMAAPSIEQAIATSCPATTEQNFKMWQCFHGMGHGIMMSTNKDHAKSISLCERLPSAFAVKSCVNGVFMERFIVVSHTGMSVAPESETDIKLCAQQKTDYQADCYTYAPTAYLERHENQYNTALQWCRQMASDYTAACIGGVGSQAMKDNISNPRFAAELCKRAAGYQTNCAEGAIGIFINHNASSAAAEPLCTQEFKVYAKTCQETIQQKKVALGI